MAAINSTSLLGRRSVLLRTLRRCGISNSDAIIVARNYRLVSLLQDSFFSLFEDRFSNETDKISIFRSTERSYANASLHVRSACVYIYAWP